MARGNGDGTFGPAIALGGPLSPLSIAAADLNGDGKPDLAFGAPEGVTVLLNRY